MNLVIVEDHVAMSMHAADIIQGLLSEKPNATLMLATGNTPMETYRIISERRKRGDIDTTKVHVFQLDGYLGIAKDDPRSLERWLVQSVIVPWEVPPSHFVRLPEDAPDPLRVCHEYDEEIRRAGGLDLAILGLGPNGHLGFNEPPSRPASPTRVVTLTSESLESNARYWGGIDLVPKQAITAGMTVIMQARHVVLLVSGQHKQQILRRTLDGPIHADVPASYLRLHPNVTVIADREAWRE